MSQKKPDISMTLTVYDTHGDVVAVVGEDSDGLDLVEIKESGGMDYEQVMAVADALVKVATHIRERSSK